MTNTSSAGDARIGALVRSGKLRLALFLPQYAQDAATGALRGLGTGHAAEQIAPLIAARLGVDLEMLGYPTPPSAVAALKAGECDILFLGITPSRVAELDFSPAIFEFDYAYLVPPGSAIRNAAELDRPGIAIAIIEGHASALALATILKHARMIGAEMPDAAFAIRRAGGAQAFACPRDVLLSYAATLPGARVLEDAYGVNRVGIALRKGEAGFLAFIAAFVAEIKQSGFVARLVQSEHLRGFRVAR